MVDNITAIQRFQLMPELLLTTFDYLDRRDLQVSAHTCHGWRAPAIGHPECLWTVKLHAQIGAQGNQQLIELFADFRQSVEYILKIDLKIDLQLKITVTTSQDHNQGAALLYSTGLDLLHSVMPCIHQLNLSDDNGLDDIEDRLIGTFPAAPNLRQLRIYVKPSYPSGIPRNVRIPAHIFQGQAPRLRRLNLDWIWLPSSYVPAFAAATYISAFNTGWSPVHLGTDAATYAQYTFLNHLQIADKLVGELTTRTRLLQRLQSFEARMPFKNASEVYDAPPAWMRSLSEVPTLTFSHANVWEGDDPDHAIVALAKAMNKPLALNHAGCPLIVDDYHYGTCNDQRSSRVLWPQRTELFTHRSSSPIITITCCGNYHVIAPYLRFLDLQFAQLHRLTHRWNQICFSQLEDMHIRLPHAVFAECPDCSHEWRPSHPTVAPNVTVIRLSHIPAEDGPDAPILLAWETASKALSCVTTERERVDLLLQHNFFEETDSRYKLTGAWYARSRVSGQGLEAVAEDYNAQQYGQEVE